MLGQTGEAGRRHWYDQIWQYAVEHQIDPQRGGWYPVLTRARVRKDVDCARGRPDLSHPLVACLLALDVLAADSAWNAAPGASPTTKALRRDGPA